MAPRSSSRSVKRIVLLGAPGVGKGTQAEILSSECRIPHISAGDLLRDEVARKTKLGLQAKAFMDDGKLVPDELVIEMMKPHLSGSFILDGFPRTLEQARELDRIVKLTHVVELTAPTDVLIKRLTGRWTCTKCGGIFHESQHDISKCGKCGGKLYQRDDQKPDVVKKRLATYGELTMPLSAFYKRMKLLKQVESLGAPETVAEKIRHALGGKAC
ncbi:Adenylate kinase [Candidatus Norongarragalina meridionalis]|nr:Adenylate kinase [Candidatus Norongarragalina meridionalis]